MNFIFGWLKSRIPFDVENLKKFGAEPVPAHLKHWWWCIGGTPAYLFLVQLATGILLAFYYVPNADHAYESVKNITEQVAFGWYIRSIHHWGSHLMIVSVILHMMRVFFTGGYRAPRELNWMIGSCLLLITLVFGFTGYSLVYEQLSYWGATVAGNITQSVPFIGTYLADFIRGGEKISSSTLTRFFAFHIGVLPTLSFLLIGIHLFLIRLHGVTEFPVTLDPKKKFFPFFPDHFLTEICVALVIMFLLTWLAIVFPAGLSEKANPLVTPPHIKPEWYFYFSFRILKLTSLTFAVLAMGFGFFVLLTWPLIDTWLRRKHPRSETSVWLGVLGVIALLVLTLWEAIVLHYHH